MIRSHRRLRPPARVLPVVPRHRLSHQGPRSVGGSPRSPEFAWAAHDHPVHRACPEIPRLRLPSRSLGRGVGRQPDRRPAGTGENRFRRTGLVGPFPGRPRRWTGASARHLRRVRPPDPDAGERHQSRPSRHRHVGHRLRQDRVVHAAHPRHDGAGSGRLERAGRGLSAEPLVDRLSGHLHAASPRRGDEPPRGRTRPDPLPDERSGRGPADAPASHAGLARSPCRHGRALRGQSSLLRPLHLRHSSHGAPRSSAQGRRRSRDGPRRTQNRRAVRTPDRHGPRSGKGP